MGLDVIDMRAEMRDENRFAGNNVMDSVVDSVFRGKGSCHVIGMVPTAPPFKLGACICYPGQFIR